MIKLYGRGQSRSFRAVWALEEVNASYEYISVDFGSAEANGTNHQDYRELNPQGKVPTFVDGDCILTESGAILNYLAAAYPAFNLLPLKDLKLRALYDQFCFFVLSDLEQPLWTNGKHRFALPTEQRVPEVLPITIWEFKRSINALEAVFKPQNQDFVLGATFSMADILTAHTLNWAERFKFEIPPALLAYRDKLYQRPACQRALGIVQ